MIGVASAPGGRRRRRPDSRKASHSQHVALEKVQQQPLAFLARSGDSLAPKATRAARVFFDRVIRSPTEQDGPTAPCPADRGRQRDE